MMPVKSTLLNEFQEFYLNELEDARYYYGELFAEGYRTNVKTDSEVQKEVFDRCIKEFKKINVLSVVSLGETCFYQ